MWRQNIFRTVVLFLWLPLILGGYESKFPGLLCRLAANFRPIALPERKCNITSLSGCPPNTRCSEITNLEGECICDSGFIFNALFTGDQDYCFVDQTTIRPAAAVSDQSAPHHHIIGGILIPLVLVAVLIGGAYATVRYRLLQRLRDRFGGRRRQRPTYQDVMMGTEFDPPLI